MNIDQILADTEPDKLRQWDDESLEGLLADILALPAQPSVEAFFDQARRRAELVRAEIARREQNKIQKAEFDRWSADMFQRIQAHDDAMKVARDQLDHQKKVSLVSTIVAVVAALAAVASAIASLLVRQ